MKWKFYINGQQVHEPSNWKELKFKITRSKTYWGLYKEASISEAIFQKIVSRTIPNGYDVLKALFDEFGVNAEANLLIEKWNEDSGSYDTWDVFNFDFSEYSEVYDRELGIAVKCNLINSGIWKDLMNRENLKLVIGNDKSVEDDDIDSVDSVDVLYNDLPLKLIGEMESSFDDEFSGISDSNFYINALLEDPLSTNVNVYEWIIGVTPLKSNVDFLNGTAFNKIKRTDPNNTGNTVVTNFVAPAPIPTNVYFPFDTFNILLNETAKDYIIDLVFEVQINAIFASVGGLGGNRYINLVEADYNGSGISNLTTISSKELFVTDGTKTITISDTFTFTKQANKVYYLSFSTEEDTAVTFAQEWNTVNDEYVGLTDGFLKSDVNISTYDVNQATSHTSYSLESCLKSLLRQITGQNDILESPLFKYDPSSSFCFIQNEIFFNETMEANTPIKLLDFEIENDFDYSITIEVNLIIPNDEVLALYITPFLEPNNVVSGVFIVESGIGYQSLSFFGNIGQGNYSLWIVPFSLEFETQTFKARFKNLCFAPLNIELTTFDKIFFSNGKFLRNATTIDNEDPTLVMTFKDLWKTITSFYPLGMDIRNDKFYIDYRANLFGNEEIEIEANTLNITNAQEFYYNSVKVGNKRVPYEFTNGTEEFNTELEFSLPIKSKDTALDLITKYNTDYLGVTLARLLTFSETNTEDTKYDDKNFMVFCELIGQWQTKKYDDFSNYPSEDYIYNVEFSPKRALLRNSDLLKSVMWKNQTGKARFESIENLSNLISDGITERADVEFSEFEDTLFVPQFLEVEVGEKNISQYLQNKNALINFTIKGVEYSGYVWEADITNGIGSVKILRKWQ